MKQILYFIENTSAPYLKSILYLYLILFLAYMLLCATGFIINLNSVMSALFYLGFPMLLFIHYKRYKAFIHNGGITRIRLLPIKKNSFLFSELLFQMITYTGLFFTNVFSWCVIYLFISNKLPYLHNTFLYYIMSNKMMLTYMPISFFNIIFDITLLITITCISTLVLISSETRKQTHTAAMYIFISFVIATILFFIPSDIYPNIEKYSLLFLLLALIPLHIYYLRAYFIWKRR